MGSPALPEQRLVLWVAVVGLFATSLTFGSMFLSPLFAGAALPAVLGNAQPLLIAGLSVAILGEKLTKARTVGLALGSIGLLSVILPTLHDKDLSMTLGGALALAASLSAAIGTVLARGLKLGKSLLPFAAWQLIIGGFLLLVASSVFGEPSHNWSWRFMGIVTTLGVLNSAAVTLLWFWLLQKEEASKLGAYLFATPVLGIIWAAVFRNETPPTVALLGAALIAFGIIYTESEGWTRSARS